MSAPVTKSSGQTSNVPECSVDTAELLLKTFTEMRDELISTLTYVLGSTEEAQDVAQDAFLRCWRNQSSLPQVENLRAWIYRVGLNAAKDVQKSAWRRKVKQLQGDEIMASVETCSPLQGLEDRETLEHLRGALLDLRPEEKEVFLLRQNGDLTYEQIADLQGRPVGTVKTQMRSALQKLRKVLAPGT